MVSGLENTLRSAERGISRVGFVRPLCDFRRRLVLNSRLSSRPIAFGAGFVLTVERDSGTAVVNVAEGVSPGVVQKIFESVLNGSRYLDVSFHQVMNDNPNRTSASVYSAVRMNVLEDCVRDALNAFILTPEYSLQIVVKSIYSISDSASSFGHCLSLLELLLVRDFLFGKHLCQASYLHAVL